MPIYEFTCRSCESEFEEFFQKNDIELGVHCPVCQSTSIDRKYSTFGFSSGRSSGTAASTSGCATCSSKNCSTCR